MHDNSSEMLRPNAQCNAEHYKSDSQVHNIDTVLIEVQLYLIELIHIPENG